MLEGLDIIKLTKTPLIYSVSRFNLEGLGALFGGISTPNPLRGAGTGLIRTSEIKIVLNLPANILVQ